jgi:hypothetical protein
VPSACFVSQSCGDFSKFSALLSRSAVNHYTVARTISTSYFDSCFLRHLYCLEYGRYSTVTSTSQKIFQLLTSLSRPIASAVVLPEEPSPSSNPAKRRFSNSADEQSKRPRLSDSDDQEPQTTATSNGNGDGERPNRRLSGQQEERKRGQRLFGNLLGTLSQSSSSAAQRRRVDIEKKQQEKLKLQAEGYNEKRKEDLGRLNEIRIKEQAKYDEQSVGSSSVLHRHFLTAQQMRIRHSNMLAMAHSLQTKTSPILVGNSSMRRIRQSSLSLQYYKPWELRPAEETTIKDRIRDTGDVIDGELDEFEQRRQRQRSASKIAEEQQAVDGETRNGNSTVGLMNTEKISDHAMEDSTNRLSDVPDHIPGKVVTPIPKEEDDGGEVMLEGEEDTVIY